MKKKATRFLASLTAAAAISAVCCTPLANMGVSLPINVMEASAADTLVSGDYQYCTDDKGAVIKKYTGTAAEVKVPAELDGNKVYAISEYAFQKNDSIISVTFPDSLKKIGGSAFNSCKALKSVTFNEGLESMGSYAFSGTALTEVSIPTTLTDAVYPFNGCGITKASFAEGTKRIPNWIFKNCPKLADITVPETVTAIGSSAFNGCSSITEFTFHEGLTTLGSYSFSGTALTEVSLPTTLTDTVYPFNGCGITKASFEEGTVRVPNWIFRNCSKLTDVTLPETVTNIGSYAFNGCSSLKEFTFHEGLTTLGSYSFSGTALTEVSLPTTLSDTVYPFNGCGITKASFAEGTEKVPSWIFRNCPKLTDVTLPKTVTNIGSYAFNSCSSLKEFTFHEGLTTLGNYAFSGTALTEVALPTTLNDAVYPFNGCGITKASFAEGAVKVPTWIFKNCNSLTDVTLPKTIKNIGIHAFNDCKSLEKISFSEGLETIGSNAFLGTAITEITLPSTLKTASFAFTGCKLEKVTFADGITAIPSNALTNCSMLKEVVLPDSLKAINSSAFENCTSLNSIELPSSVEKLEGSCFKNSGITGIVIPDSVKNLSSSIFSNCKNLKTVTLGSGISTVYTSTFSNCTSLEKVTFTSPKLKLLANAFLNCRSLKEVDYSNTDLTFDRLSFSKCYALKDMDLIYLDRPTSTMTITTENTAVSGIVDLTVDFEALSGHYNEDSSFTVALTVPDGVTLIPDSFKTADGPVSAEEAETKKITFSAPKGKLTFSAMATESGTFDIDADLIFKNERVERVEPIHSVRFTADVLSLSVPSTTNSTKITVNGTGPKGKAIEVYLDDKLIGSPVADAVTGRYTLPAELPDGADGSKYVLKAKFGDTVTSDFTVLYSKEQPAVNSIKLGINGKDADTDITDVFTMCKSPVMYYIPSKAVTFTADISNSDLVEKVCFTSTKQDNTSTLEAEYNKDTGLWTAKGYFDNSKSYTPGELNVVVVTKSEYEKIQAAKAEVDFTKGYFSRSGNIRFTLAPTGRVYEGAPSNAVSGAEMTLYHMGEDGKAAAWDSKNSDQQNPLYTDDLGAYTWDIPEGNWKILCKAEGYDAMESEWITFPSSETSIDFSLVSSEAPKITDISYNGTDIVLKFSKYMLPDTINLITVSLDSGNDIKIIPVLHETNEDVTDTFYISGDFNADTDVKVEVRNGCLSYAGTEAEPTSKSVHIDAAATTTTTTSSTTTTTHLTTTTTANPATTSTSTQPVTTSATTQPVTTSTTTKPVTTSTTTKPVTTSTTTNPVTTSTATNPATTSTTTKPATTSTTTKPVTTSTTTNPATTSTTTNPATTSTTTKPATTSTTTKPVTTSTTTNPVTTSTTTKPVNTSTSTTSAVTTTTVTTTAPITTTTQPPEPKKTFGDYNGDGAVNAVDASYILAAYAENSTNHKEATAEQIKLGDINKDGKMNAVDASYILSYYAYWSTKEKISLEEYLGKAL
ncbi:leucine-rich repeat protein [Ruminococcus flavefaciens]|uniref:leucine-rich repeat protein n=1 Tax=Ruminococcus flavefaciens TaxID=1265 RepID=UPI0026F0CA3A|nr:leucine-rich repeat protein [Ruminococcus flavefaciens]